VPLNAPVVELNETPLGNVPDSLNVGAGDPLAVTVNSEFVPTVKVVLAELVMAGALLVLLDAVFWPFCESADVAGRELLLTVVNVLVPENKLWLLLFPIEPRMS
jgi:hypothetical protein